MPNPTYDIKLPYRMYCNLPECGKPTFHVFKIEIDGVMCTFCSSDHARLGEARWVEKKEKDVRMGVPPPENNDEYTSGHVPGEEGE